MRSLPQVLKPVVQKMPLLALAYRVVRDLRKTFDAPAMTPLGFRFNGNTAMERGAFEPLETNLVRRLLEGITVTINVGANIGYYCCIALQAGVPVVAFEPMPQNLRYLLRNIQSNGWDAKSEVFPVALSDEIGIAKIYGWGTGASLVSGWAGSSDRYFSLVPVSTLNTVLGTRFIGKSMLFIVDVEGAEMAMLQGATNYLDATPRPTWMVEIAALEHQSSTKRINPNLVGTFDLFFRRGYAVRTVDEKFRPVTRDEVERVAATGHDTLGTHNFVFAEKSILDQIGATWTDTGHVGLAR